MSFRLPQFRLRSAVVMFLFYGLILALVMQTIRAERLEAELRDRTMQQQAAMLQAVGAEQQARINAEMALRQVQQNALATQRAQDAGPIED